MSDKMPITDLLTESFSFGFNRYFTVLRCLLVPYLIVVFGMIALIVGLMDFGAIAALENASDPDSLGEIFAMLGSIFRMSLPATMALFFLGAMVLSLPFTGGIASIYRLIGLGEEPGGWFTIRLDGPMWRTFFAFLIWGIIQYAIYGVAFFIVWSLNPGMFEVFGQLDMADDNPEVLISLFGSMMSIFLVALIFMIFIFTKLAPFPAASACENRLMLLNSWTKTKGHFWTILGGYILLSLALGLASQVMSFFLQIVIGIVASAGAEAAVIIGLAILVCVLVYFGFIFFSIGVQMAFPAAIYRRLWRE